MTVWYLSSFRINSWFIDATGTFEGSGNKNSENDGIEDTINVCFFF